MRIFSDIDQIYSLTILMKHLLKEKYCQSSGWFRNKIYMNNKFCSITLY